MIEFETALVASAAGIVRRRLHDQKPSPDIWQDLHVAVLTRCKQASATPRSVVWRAAHDVLKTMRDDAERKELRDDVHQCHDQFLRADRATVASLPPKERYAKSGEYGLPGRSRRPALPYLTESACRFLSVENAAGVSTLEAECDAIADFFAARELTAVE